MACGGHEPGLPGCDPNVVCFPLLCGCVIEFGSSVGVREELLFSVEDQMKFFTYGNTSKQRVGCFGYTEHSAAGECLEHLPVFVLMLFVKSCWKCFPVVQ